MKKTKLPPTWAKKIPERQKATFSLSVKILNRLERYWIAARKKMPGASISKTKIVETALEDFLNG